MAIRYVSADHPSFVPSSSCLQFDNRPSPNMSLADYLAKNYLTADSEKKSKKRKRKNKDGGLTIDDDDNLGWNKNEDDDDEDAPMVGGFLPPLCNYYH